jgi:L-ascorbate metabolism protein UlaG (beta-lactamase superfamily)
MLIAAFLVLVFILAVIIFMQQPKFGKIPAGERLSHIKNSPNYREGKFQNLNHTPDLTEGTSYFKVMKEFFFDKNKRATPSSVLPSKKTDLYKLNPDKDILVWFGHSSYFMQADGKKILVDPVLSGSASPIRFTTKSFKGTDVYTTDDIPAIDYLFLSHDHWDHLDHDSIIQLKPKIGKVICGLGVAEHLEQWGYDSAIIIEKDWNEEIVLDKGFVVHTLPARHFSGRGFKRNQSLWMSYALTTPHRKIYIGGDSGYDTHFATIGNMYGPFDLAILECGQYNKNWKYIHMMPEEVVMAAQDLKAKMILAVHNSKFLLGQHAWDEPITRVVKESKQKNVNIVHPMIGEEVDLGNPATFTAWWENID